MGAKRIDIEINQDEQALLRDLGILGEEDGELGFDFDDGEALLAKIVSVEYEFPMESTQFDILDKVRDALVEANYEMAAADAYEDASAIIDDYTNEASSNEIRIMDGRVRDGVAPTLVAIEIVEPEDRWGHTVTGGHGLPYGGA